MANKLPWFKLWVGDWMGSSRVRRLSGDQMAAYLWLLCEQWERGSLPFDVTMVTPGVPKGISDASVAYILTEFFPPDPDTNERRNPRLELERTKAEAEHKAKTAALQKARAAKSLKHNNLSDDRPVDRDRVRSQSQKSLTTTAGSSNLTSLLPTVVRRLTRE